MLIRTRSTYEEEASDLKALAQKLIQRRVYVNWPYLKTALVVGVSTEMERCMLDDAEGIAELLPSVNTPVFFRHRAHIDEEKNDWCKQRNAILNTNESRYGLLTKTGDIRIMLHVKYHIGSVVRVEKETQHVYRQHLWTDGITMTSRDTAVPVELCLLLPLAQYSLDSRCVRR